MSAPALNEFTLLNEDNNSYTVGHPSKGSFKLIKGGLHPDAEAAISDLKKTQGLDGGGPLLPTDGTVQPPIAVPAPDQTPVEDDPTDPALNEAETETPDAGQPLAPAASPDWTGSVGHASDADARAPASAAPQAQTGVLPDNTMGLQTAKTALEADQAAQGVLSKSAAGAWNDYINSTKDLPTAQDRVSQYKPQAEAIQNSIAQNKIDPNRYWNNMSTGSQISSGVAMILGGIGAGLTGQPNQPLSLMQAAIDRDIDAQKSDQSKNMNLWKMNRENLQSDIAADAATREQAYSVAKGQLLKAGAIAQDPIEKARIAQSILPIDQQIQTQQWIRAMTEGNTSPGSESQYVNSMKVMEQLKPDMYKDMQGKYIPNIGTSRVPLNDKDREALTAYDQLDSNLKDAIDYAKTTGTTGPAWLTEAGVTTASKRSNIVLFLNKLHDLNRLNDHEFNTYLSQVYDPGAWRTGAAIKSFEELRGALSRQKLGEYKNLGITPFQKTPIDQQAIAWAQQNPNDPRARDIMGRNKNAGSQ